MFNNREYTMDCSKVKVRMKAYLDRELPDTEAQALQVHIQNCPLCATEAERISKVWNMLGALPEQQTVPDLIPGTLARIRAQQKEPVWDKITRWLSPVTGPAIAATALAVGIYIGTGIGFSLSQSYITPATSEDPLYLEVFNDVPPQSIGDAYLSIDESKEG
jgi:anti-sigma factor RsiW